MSGSPALFGELDVGLRENNRNRIGLHLILGRLNGQCTGTSDAQQENASLGARVVET